MGRHMCTHGQACVHVCVCPRLPCVHAASTVAVTGSVLRIGAPSRDHTSHLAWQCGAQPHAWRGWHPRRSAPSPGLGFSAQDVGTRGGEQRLAHGSTSSLEGDLLQGVLEQPEWPRRRQQQEQHRHPPNWDSSPLNLLSSQKRRGIRPC